MNTPNLFQLGNFTLSSGKTSRWKIECDALTDDDITTLAEMIRQMVGPFSSVEGVPTGGLRLAKALEPFIGLDGPHLIVDDVLTTGGSMVKTLHSYLDKNPKFHWSEYPKGAVIFARGQCPHWVKSLFQLPECFWATPRHR